MADAQTRDPLVGDSIWSRVPAERVGDATLATLLSCSAEEVARWRSGEEPTPDVVQRHLDLILSEGGRWHDALADRPQAARVLPWGAHSAWLRPMLSVAVLVPFTVLALSYMRGFRFTPVPWLGEGLLLATGMISVRLVRGLLRMTGPRCSLCGKVARDRDRTCPGCQADLTE